MLQLTVESPKRNREDALSALYEYETKQSDLETLYWAIKFDYYDDQQSGEVRSLLLSKLGEIKHPTTPGFIESVYCDLPLAARETALGVLSELNTIESLAAWGRILVNSRPVFPLDNMNTEHIIRDPQHVQSIVSQLAKLVDNRNYRRGTYRILAAAVEKGCITFGALKPLSRRIIGDYEESIRQYERAGVGTSRRVLAIEYATAVVMILGELAYGGNSRVVATLWTISAHRNSQIAFAATCQLLRAGCEIKEPQIERFMVEPTTRIEMYRRLRELGRNCKCSPTLLTQEAFAESDLARHLLMRDRYPASNVRVIGSRECIIRKRRGRVYILKYANEVHGWSGLIGLSGPWPLDGSVISRGELTFSANRSEKSMSIDEHFSELMRLARRGEEARK